jgi:NAD(P)-dependent dehydrogenase (short-subunit alcohol dehydrogenase family)
VTTDKVAVVIGVGALQGLGAAVAIRFAREGYTAVVAGRTAGNLDAVVQEIKRQGFQAYAVATDATSEEQIVRLLASAEQIGPLAVAVFNAGGNNPSASLDTTGKFFENMWRVGAYGGFVFAREAVQLMKPRGQGTLLFTGASASLRGKPDFVAFASAKAALRAVSQAFAREFGPKGIHVAHVVIDGAIDGDRIHKFAPQFVKMKGESGLLKLEAIAEAYWQLHAQHKTAWSQEIDLRPFKEPF